jgi:hypothetical protein
VALAFAKGALRWDTDFLYLHRRGLAWIALTPVATSAPPTGSGAELRQDRRVETETRNPALGRAGSPRRRGHPRLGSQRRAHSLCAHQRRRHHPPLRRVRPRGITVGVEGKAGGDSSPISGTSSTSPHINDAVPMSKMTGPSTDRKPKAIELVPSAARMRRAARYAASRWRCAGRRAAARKRRGDTNFVARSPRLNGRSCIQDSVSGESAPNR